MKIALVIFRADPARGGAERYTVDLATALASRGHEVSLLASEFGDVGQARAVTVAADSSSRLGRYRAFLDRLDEQLDRESYDIVHAMLPVRRCQFYHPHAGLAADTIARGHEKYDDPVRRTLSRVANRLNRKRGEFAAVERELLTGAHSPIVLCLSDYVASLVRRYLTLPADRIAKLFNAVDLERFNPQSRPDAGAVLRKQLGIEEDAIIALMIAQDFVRKGLPNAIKALAAVGDARLRLLVVGKEDPAPYIQLAKAERVADRICFAGPTQDVYSFYRAADFFVLPTRHDPCSLVLLEALAMGLPAISTKQNGATEIMTTGREGFVLDDPADVPALADAMRAMLDEPARQSMAEAALALRPQLAYAKHLDTLETLYRRIPRGTDSLGLTPPK